MVNSTEEPYVANALKQELTKLQDGCNEDAKGKEKKREGHLIDINLLIFISVLDNLQLNLFNVTSTDFFRGSRDLRKIIIFDHGINGKTIVSFSMNCPI